MDIGNNIFYGWAQGGSVTLPVIGGTIKGGAGTRIKVCIAS